MPRKLLYFTIAFFTIFYPILIYADEIIFASDEWAPVIILHPNPGAPGYLPDLAKAIFSKKNHTLKVLSRPFAKAVFECRGGSVNGVLGVVKGGDVTPDFVFPKKEQLLGQFDMFTLKESSWTYSGTGSLKKIRLGVVLDYDCGKELNEYIHKYKDSKMVDIITGDNPLERNIKKLLARKVDAIAATQEVFWYLATKMGIKDKFREAGQISPPKKVYIAFSPKLKTSVIYAKILSDGMDELRASGELSEILAKYGLKDWVKK